MHPDLRAAFELHKKGKLPEAERAYRGLLRKNPRQPGAFYLLAVLANEVGKPEEAAELTRRAISLNNRVAAYHFNLATALISLGKPDEAETALRRTLELEPQHADAMTNLGRICWKRGELDKAEELLTDAVTVNRKSVSAWLNLASFRSDQGQMDEAIRCNGSALSIDPECAEAHSNLCWLYLGRREVDLAVEHGKKAVELRPQLASGHNNLALAYRSRDEFDACIRQFYYAIRLDSENPRPRNNVAHLLQETGRPRAALVQYQAAVDLAPDNPLYAIDRARFLLTLGRAKEAANDARRAIELDVNNPDAHIALGDAHVAMDRLDLADASYRQAIQCEPTSAGALCKLAELLLQLGERKAAVFAFREATRCDPEFGNAWVGLALQFPEEFSKEERESLESWTQKAFLKDEARASLHYGLAQVEDSAGRKEQAASHWRAAMRYQIASRSKHRIVYDSIQYSTRVDRMLQWFSPELFRRLRKSSRPTIPTRSTPIFVVGIPDRVTETVAELLARHPDVSVNRRRPWVQESFESATRQRKDGQSWPDYMVQEQEGIAAASDALWKKYQGLAQGDGPIVDVSRDNGLLLGWIWTVFPDAKVVHCIRDPRAIAFDTYTRRALQIPWASNPDELAMRIRDELRLMQQWRGIAGDRLIEFKQAEIANEWESVAQRLLAYIPLRWDPKLVNQVRYQIWGEPTDDGAARPNAEDLVRWQAYESHLPDLFAPYSKSQ